MTVRQRLRFVSLVVAAAPAAMLGFAYYVEYVVGLLPCMLCLYQRPPHYVAAIAGLLAFTMVGGPRLASRALLGLAGAALLAGAIIAFFHTGVELKLWLGPTECGGRLAPLVTDLNDLGQAMKDTKLCNATSPAGSSSASRWPPGTAYSPWGLHSSPSGECSRASPRAGIAHDEHHQTPHTATSRRRAAQGLR